MPKRTLGVIVCVFLWTPGYAQTLGTITGEVKDTSGAVIPGATVTAQNVGHQRGPYPEQQRGRSLHISGDASRRLHGQS